MWIMPALLIFGLLVPFVVGIAWVVGGRKHTLLRVLVPLTATLPLAAFGLIAGIALLHGTADVRDPQERFLNYVGASVFLLLCVLFVFMAIGLARIAIKERGSHDKYEPAQHETERSGEANDAPSAPIS